MKTPTTIATLAGARGRRVRRRGIGIAHRLFTLDVARGLAPALAAVLAIALLVATAPFLPAHPLALVGLWVGATGLLIALPYVVVRLVGVLVFALER